MSVAPREVEDTHEPESNTNNRIVPWRVTGSLSILTMTLHLYIHPLLFLLPLLQHYKKWLQSKIVTTGQPIALQSVKMAFNSKFMKSGLSMASFQALTRDLTPFSTYICHLNFNDFQKATNINLLEFCISFCIISERYTNFSYIEFQI